MSTKEPTGFGITNNRKFLKEQVPNYALQQLADSKLGKANTRAKAVKTNASLPTRSWEVLDQTVIETQDQTLTLVQDLLDAGLRTETDLMAKIDTWPLVDDTGEASAGMTPETASDEGTLGFDDDGVPVPVIYDFFTLGFREAPTEDSGRAVGESLDTLGLSTTTRRCNEKTEEIFVDGWGETINYEGDGYNLYGLTNHPQTNTGTVSSDWTVDASVIRDDVRAMRGVIKNDNDYSLSGSGAWLYLGTDFYDTLDDADPEGSGDSTVRDRVENLSGIGAVRELEQLGSKEALMFRPTEDVVDVGVASEFMPVQWESPFRDHWAVMGSLYPRVKSTKTGQSAVVHYTL